MKKHICGIILILALVTSTLILFACNDNDYVDYDTCEHNFSEWTVTKEATCESTGTRQRTCTKCDTTEKSDIEKSDHTRTVTHIEEATCAKSGLQIISCSVCHSVLDQVVIPSLKHDLIEREAKAPTCTQDGWDAYLECSKCEYNTMNSIPALEHNFVGGICTRCNTPSAIQAEYNTYAVTMPTNWNSLFYTDENDLQILNYINSSLFEYDYKFENDRKYNSDGSLNKDSIVSGAYTVQYSAATRLEDVTASVSEKWGYTDKQKQAGGYAWKITLRDDLKWSDGTAITASDFVYSMKAMLDPNFNSYFSINQNIYSYEIIIKNATEYLRQNEPGVFMTVKDCGFKSNAEAIEEGFNLYLNTSILYGDTIDDYVDENGNPIPLWITGDKRYAKPSDWATGAPGSESLTANEIFEVYNDVYLEVGCLLDSGVAICVSGSPGDVDWADVGIYAIDGENAIVLCLNKSQEFFNIDGSLTYLAAQYLNLPLVKRDIFEITKVAPDSPYSSWVSTYNSSLETTASWGPYMLVEFVPGSHYRLEKNPNWYGWGLEQYRNQYNVTAINCHKVKDAFQGLVGFIDGVYDTYYSWDYVPSEYLDSDYISYSTQNEVSSMYLFSNAEVLKNSGNNNGILAIREFRWAFNLALNRSDVIDKIWPSDAEIRLGIFTGIQYYDAINSPNLADGGVYRNSAEAKVALVRAYGYTFDATTNLWSYGGLANLTLDEAYESITGFNLGFAREKLNEAIAELTANPEKYGYDSSKNITLVFGSAIDSDKFRYRAEYIQNVLNNLTLGTALEGKIVVKFDATAGNSWRNAFLNGETQIGFGYGITAYPFNIVEYFGAFIDPLDECNYTPYWDTSDVYLTISIPKGEFEGAGETIRMSALNWYYCIAGKAAQNNQPYTYNWSEGKAPSNVRLKVLAALEEIVISECNAITLTSSITGTFTGAKFRNFSNEYNYFMEFGGIRYLEVVYTDAEWVEVVRDNDLSKLYKSTD